MDDVPENVGDGVRLPPGSFGAVSGEDTDIVREYIQITFFEIPSRNCFQDTHHDVFADENEIVYENSGLGLKNVKNC